MSESSSNIHRSNLNNKPKDIQGGEKKVMKKSLKVIATATMAFSMFASVAMADTTTSTTTTPTATTTATTVKTSKDFKDLAGLDATVTAKIDAMLAKGYFEGTAADSFGIKENMTRAQFAKVLVLVSGVKVDNTVKVSSFDDVKADDTANGWAIPFIEAAKKAGLVDGKTDKTFDPGANVTLGEFATALVKGLGKKVDTTGTPWYADAVKQAIAAKVLPEGTDGAAFATRADLVVGAFTADAAISAMGKVSVSEAKATGVKTVTVTFNKPVDDTKANVALTKGSVAVATTAKFADDKKSVVLTLTDVKIGEGTYTATLSGLDAAGVDKTTATFTAENEKVSKLEFVNAGEKIAKSVNAVVRVKATNQYGEVSSLTTGNYTAYVSGTTQPITRNDDTGYLELTIDTSAKQPEIDVIPVNVFLTNSSVSVQKVFKVGTEPYVTKIELGNVKYPATKTALTSQGDTAEISITRYDQYGDKIVWNNSYAQAIKDRLAVGTPIITPFSFDALAYDAVNSTYDTLKVKLANNIDKAGDYQVSFYVGASTATATIKTQSSLLAQKVEFGEFNGVIAEGDGATAGAMNGATYIPVVAYDAAGAKLSAQDIADNADLKRFSISVSGADYASGNNGNDAIVRTGEHKGQIKLDNITSLSKGVVYLNLGIYNANVQTNAQTSFTVQDSRKPETIVLDGDKPAQKGLLGATTTVKWIVKDQYGATLKKTVPSLQANYKVSVTVTGQTYATFTNTAIAGAWNAATSAYEFTGANLDAFNSKDLVFTAALAGGKDTVKAELIDVAKASTIKSVDSSLQVVGTSGLTYSVNAVKDLFAALDNSATPADDKELTAAADTLGNANGIWATSSKFARKLAVKAIDKSGDAVAITGSRIISAGTSDSSVAKAVYNAGDVYVLGNKAGKATLTVVFKKDGGSTQDQTLDLNVKADAVTAASISADANKTGLAGGATTVLALMPNLKVVDNYGVEYTDTDIAKYSAFLGVQYVVSGAKNCTVTIDNSGAVTVTDLTTSANPKFEFSIKAITANGKSVSTLVTN
ncbi:S-layer homology domain-containing protein [Paenibacillus sp. yr247]|uniref:S-layer homology domain-containing protein n=1 Tax=Paenibacillus sp. yr247 TaxID=1761880 RepID=UPI0008853BCA|nr:S-layer homology domain-containing protein [Paenibacillus sp. yr247]SDO62168.1 S-layer homology domain-containing protein [Paenibacillus sp. yr247]